jgi:hypothetical protein
VLYGVSKLDDERLTSRHDKRFFSPPESSCRLCETPSLLFNGYEDYLLVVMHPGREVEHLPPSLFEVRNEWSFTSTPIIYPIDFDRENLTFTFIYYFTPLNKYTKSI